MIVEGEQIGGERPWVAKIKGQDEKYGLERDFCVGIKDYSRANSKRTRGVYTSWMLSDGVYETSLPRSWNRTTRQLIVIEGDVSREISTVEALQILKKK